MCTMYILSGRVFGKNIYEINCTSSIYNRVLSQVTGFPDYNILHYSHSLKETDMVTCQNMIIDTLYINKLKNGYFYKIDLHEAIYALDTIVDNINYANAQKKEKTSCF